MAKKPLLCASPYPKRLEKRFLAISKFWGDCNTLLHTIYVGLLLGLAVNQIDTATVFSNAKRPALNIAVVGAGAAGLCSAKHCLAEGHEVTVYEQSEEIGGVWYYTDEIGKDKYGVPIHTSMYQGLRRTEISPFICKPFRIEKSNQIASHLVVRVLPIKNDKWEVLVKNLPKNTFETIIYDVVFVCNGHNSKPFIPNIDSADEFKGKLIHSHDYRKPEPFRNTSVLVIGPGPSGKDLVAQLAKFTKRVAFSRHKIVNETDEDRKKRQSLYSPNVILKDDVTRFTSTGAEFIDGSHETFDVVFFATGYNSSYPFLSVNSGVYVKKKLVQPLYKHIFNVEHPTMAFIGISPFAPTIPMFDLQVRFVLKFLSGAKKLPTKAEMLKDVQMQPTRRRPYNLLPDRIEYIKQISELADIEPVPDVFVSATKDSIVAGIREPNDFRKYRYMLINDKSFKKE
ncbi:dimethylaniline monooxygenase [N-oxide-forming] 3-like, partial [Contarinia nasturtii]|uniref:dimethylaniline monooxygenase [N-oxide-forming] 3-like n=1 Tax=Contarinia nasturtii TaxID=265458 RepID=UPI0012D43584